MHLRGAQMRRRKRYGRYDSRRRLAGKRPITARPAAAEARTHVGHWEADTILGAGQSGPCLLSLVERKTGYLVLGKLRKRTTAEVNQRAIRLIRRQQRPVQTITADNGTEFHSYSAIEHATTARFYFARGQEGREGKMSFRQAAGVRIHQNLARSGQTAQA